MTTDLMLSVALRHRDCDVNKFIQENKLSPEDLSHQPDDEVPEKNWSKISSQNR